MEALHQGYLDIMSMPIGRRKRLVEEKDNLARVQEQKNRNRGKGRRR